MGLEVSKFFFVFAQSLNFKSFNTDWFAYTGLDLLSVLFCYDITLIYFGPFPRNVWDVVFRFQFNYHQIWYMPFLNERYLSRVHIPMVVSFCLELWKLIWGNTWLGHQISQSNYSNFFLFIHETADFIALK